jgi:hypothetical protein
MRQSINGYPRMVACGYSLKEAVLLANKAVQPDDPSPIPLVDTRPFTP